MNAPTPTLDEVMSGGGKAAKFPEVGTVVKGTIVGTPTVRQATKYGSGEPEVYPSGDPVYEVLITLKTEEREDGADDGVRTVYAQRRLLKAIKDAAHAAGGKLADGGKLAVEYYADGEPSAVGFAPPKLYRAQYQAPEASLDVSSVGEPAAAAPPTTSLL